MSLEYLDRLGLLDGPRDKNKTISRKGYSELEKGEQCFDWLHLGTSPISPSKFRSINKEFGFIPPRTGHVGDWKPILDLEGGMLDYNAYICGAEGYGRPIVIDVTNVETRDPSQGDAIYTPGMIYDDGQAIELPIKILQGTRYLDSARDYPTFLPFAFAEENGRLLNISEIHERRNKCLGYDFRRLSPALLDFENPIEQLLECAIEACRLEPNPQQALILLIDREATLGGFLRRVEPEFLVTGEIKVGQSIYKDSGSLAKACIDLLKAAASANWMMQRASNSDESLPVLSNLVLLLALPAVFRLHLIENSAAYACDRVVCHPHWGAVGMAGLPPYRKGYFASQITKLKRCFRLLLGQTKGISCVPTSVIYLMAPAGIFLLCPLESDSVDAELLDTLLIDALNETSGKPFGQIQPELIDPFITLWMKQHGKKFSAAWSRRFNSKNTLRGYLAPTIHKPVNMSSVFAETPMRLLCLLTGGLDRYYGSQL